MLGMPRGRPPCFGTMKASDYHLCDGCIYRNGCQEAAAVNKLFSRPPEPLDVPVPNRNWLLFYRWLVEHGRIGPKGD